MDLTIGSPREEEVGSVVVLINQLLGMQPLVVWHPHSRKKAQSPAEVDIWYRRRLQ